jgi:hypothetical protein
VQHWCHPSIPGDSFFQETSVLHKCANPDCLILFRSLSDGKFFLLDNQVAGPVAVSRAHSAIRRGQSVRQRERFWLCDGCSSLLTLAFEPGRGMVTVPLPARNTPGLGLHLRQVQPALKMYRAELKGSL